MAEENASQATEARARLSVAMEASLSGMPQVIRMPSGEEVVILSRAEYERMKPTLKDYLIGSAGAAGEDDDGSLEAAFHQIRG